jgi:hypothetical protein
MQENKTKKDGRATTARSIHTDAIVKEENTMSVNTTINHRIERQGALVKERANSKFVLHH